MEADEPDSGASMMEPEQEPSLAQVKMKVDALDKLAPEPEEQDERMSLITIVRGKAPNLYALYQASAEWEILTAMEKKRKIDWDELDPIVWIKKHTPAINGRRSKDIVEIARSGGQEHRHSLFDILRGRSG